MKKRIPFNQTVSSFVEAHPLWYFWTVSYGAAMLILYSYFNCSYWYDASSIRACPVIQRGQGHCIAVPQSAGDCTSADCGYGTRRLKHRTQYPNPPQSTKNGIFLCCRACHTSVCLHPSALKTSRFMIAFGLPFFWFDFSSGRGKSAEYTGVCASILTMSWRKSVQKNGFVCCALCLSIRESNPICPALVKLSPFRIVGLARRQPCCTLTHKKNELLERFLHAGSQSFHRANFL